MVERVRGREGRSYRVGVSRVGLTGRLGRGRIRQGEDRGWVG